MMCRACRKEIPDDSSSCLYCGSSIGAQGAPSSPGKDSVTGIKSDERVTLVEYQLAERVEGRVWAAFKGRTKHAIIAGGIVVAFLTFFGPGIVLDYVSSKITVSLEKDAKLLRDRISEELVDMAIRTAELKSQAEVAQKELVRLKDSVHQSERMVQEYEALRQQVDTSSKRLDLFDKELKGRLEQAKLSAGKLNELGREVDEIRNRTDKLKEQAREIESLATSARLAVC